LQSHSPAISCSLTVQITLWRRTDAFIAKISPVISGCIQLGGSPDSGASVILKQKREADHSTTTNTSGCYQFDNAVSGKTFQVIINGPTVP